MPGTSMGSWINGRFSLVIPLKWLQRDFDNALSDLEVFWKFFISNRISAVHSSVTETRGYFVRTAHRGAVDTKVDIIVKWKSGRKPWRIIPECGERPGRVGKESKAWTSKQKEPEIRVGLSLRSKNTVKKVWVCGDSKREEHCGFFKGRTGFVGEYRL